MGVPILVLSRQALCTQNQYKREKESLCKHDCKNYPSIDANGGPNFSFELHSIFYRNAVQKRERKFCVDTIVKTTPSMDANGGPNFSFEPTSILYTKWLQKRSKVCVGTFVKTTHLWIQKGVSILVLSPQTLCTQNQYKREKESLCRYDCKNYLTMHANGGPNFSFELHSILYRKSVEGTIVKTTPSMNANGGPNFSFWATQRFVHKISTKEKRKVLCRHDGKDYLIYGCKWGSQF